ncbi:beta-glucosidase [Anaeromyces robustus]|uniref:beta-glucosidase n=1 Tax=Anaeromyces robustus TaxID=1754192 RepID=A0A1Y1XCP9_9FUNG|nr:beta-glucosidase [Anaeromyces robustus]|eukprot:ORX83540.1 beta-glucosidase [Anaeromyces robustus]
MKIFNIFVLAITCFSLTLASPIKKIKRTISDDEYELKHINTLDNYLAECTVLLRKNGDFPLSANETNIYLYGNGIRKTKKGGTGSGDVHTHFFENIEDAFINEGYNILSKDFLDEYDKLYQETHDKFIEDLNKGYDSAYAAMFGTMGVQMEDPEHNIPFDAEGDVAIYVLSRISGEGTDRSIKKGDVLLTDTENRMIKALATGYKKFMLVLNTGGPVDLSGLDYVENILILSQLGTGTSKTLVDIVSGTKYPSGKLATTWTKSEDYQQIGNFGDNYDTNYKEGIYVGYRYFDSSDVDALFPFGFGLGYTEFQYNVQSVELIGEEFSVDVTVENVGQYKGKEVLQLYLSKPNTSLDEPYQILVNFEKTKELLPGATDLVHLSFKLSEFASYDTTTASYILDQGSYIVRLGNSSKDTKPCGQINIESKIIVKQLQNKMGKPEFEDYTCVSSKKDSEEVLASLPNFTLDNNVINTIVQSYNKTYEIEEDVKTLTTEEKIKLVIGTFATDETGREAKYGVAGSASHTAIVGDLLPVVMADGPAGLRIAKDYFIDENGVARTTEDSVMAENLTEEFKAILRSMQPQPKEDDPIYHQYTTAIPIGTAIAQSWNREFAEICGDIVGTEMEMFHVQLWLAPALNIHRSILCGRNFEYYSEDPLISGIMASSVIKGVQKHKNTFVTVKHFAANNQETNRYTSNSNVSERALREIYLKGFEIVMRESKPRAVMSSFNLINEIHTNENRELMNDILRNEFDFDGVIMTDWEVKLGLTDKYPISTPYKVMKANVDMFMPGSEADYNNIFEALESNVLSMEELEINASRVYKLAKEIEN